MDRSGGAWLDTKDRAGGIDDETRVASPLLRTLHLLARLTLTATPRMGSCYSLLLKRQLERRKVTNIASDAIFVKCSLPTTSGFQPRGKA